MNNKILNNEEELKLVECPYCGCKPVMATVLTTYSYVSEHRICKDGIDMEDKGDRVYQILGEMRTEPTIRVTKFKCTSCGKEWGSWNKKAYKLVTDENGICSFK